MATNVLPTRGSGRARAFRCASRSLALTFEGDLCPIESAILACTTRPRPVGELYARTCKRLGAFDPDRVRKRVSALVLGTSGEDGPRRSAELAGPFTAPLRPEEAR